MRLAVASAARHGDRDGVTALLQHGAAIGLDGGMLLAVAQAHWPPVALLLRACRASWRWLRRQPVTRKRTNFG